MLQPQQLGNWARSVTYTTAHSNAGYLTHWARPGIKPTYSWILVKFVNCWAMKGTPLRGFFLLLFLFFLFFFRTTLAAYGGSQARGLNGATAAGLNYSHSNARSKPCCNLHWSSQQCLTRPGIEPTSSWFLVGFVFTAPWQELPPLRFFNHKLMLNFSRSFFYWHDHLIFILQLVIALINLQLLNHPYIAGINPSSSRCMIILMYVEFILVIFC